MHVTNSTRCIEADYGGDDGLELGSQTTAGAAVPSAAEQALFARRRTFPALEFTGEDAYQRLQTPLVGVPEYAFGFAFSVAIVTVGVVLFCG